MNIGVDVRENLTLTKHIQQRATDLNSAQIR